MSHETAVLIVNERLQVLTRREGDTVSIPKVTVDVGRAGIALSRAVREQLRMEVFCLVMPSSAVGALPMLRPQAEHSPAPNGYVWVDPVSEPQGFGQILEAFSSIDVTDKSFGRFAWYTDVQDWLGARLTQQSHTVRSLEQWNGRIGGGTPPGRHRWSAVLAQGRERLQRSGVWHRTTPRGQASGTVPKDRCGETFMADASSRSRRGDRTL